MRFGVIPQCFYKSLTKYPEHVHLKMMRDGEDICYTYADAYKSIMGVNAYLNRIDCVKPDRVAILAENRPEWVIAYLGIVWRGRIAVPLDTNLKLDALVNLMENSETKVVFTSKKFVEIVVAVASQLKAKLQIVCFDSNVEIDESAVEEVVWFKDIEKLESAESNSPACEEEDIASVIYTSGTTGNPKGVMLTHKNFMAVSVQGTEMVHLDHNDRFLCILPLYHTLAFSCSFLIPTYVGGSIFFINNISGPEIVETAANNKVTTFMGVPLLWESIDRNIQEVVNKKGRAARKVFDLLLFISKALPYSLRKWLFYGVHKKFGGCARLFMSGGAPITAKTIVNFQLMGFRFIPGYGLTETAPIISINIQASKKPGSVGKVHSDNEIRLLNPDQNGIGEICFRGPNVMKGYYKNEKATREAIDEEGFLHTGDLGSIDEDGYLTICGRLKEMIVLSDGKKVFPEELEEHYKSSDIIEEIGVVGCIEKDQGEKIVGVIVPKKEWMHGKEVEEIEQALNREIKRLSDQLAPYRRLSSIIISSEPLPRTSLKKIRHFEVQKLAMEQLSKREPLKIKNEDSALDQMLLASPDTSEVFSSIKSVILDEAIQANMTLNSRLIADLGIDSIARVELGLALANNCFAVIHDEELFHMETVRDVVMKVRELKLKEGGEINKKSWRELLQLDDKNAENPIETKPSLLRRLFLNLIRFWSKIFWKLDVRGLENLPSAPFIIAPNHSSLGDYFWVTCLLPHSISDHVYVIGKKENFEYSFLESLAKVGNVIAVDRQGNFLPALRSGARFLQNGKILLLYPEGTRTIDGALLPFKNGVSILAKEMNVPVVPVAIKGNFEVFPKRNYLPNFIDWRKFKRYSIQVVFGESISVSGEIEKGALDPEAPSIVDDFTKILRNRVHELLTK